MVALISGGYCAISIFIMAINMTSGHQWELKKQDIDCHMENITRPEGAT